MHTTLEYYYYYYPGVLCRCRSYLNRIEAENLSIVLRRRVLTLASSMYTTSRVCTLACMHIMHTLSVLLFKLMCFAWCISIKLRQEG